MPDKTKSKANRFILAPRCRSFSPWSAGCKVEIWHKGVVVDSCPSYRSQDTETEGSGWVPESLQLPNDPLPSSRPHPPGFHYFPYFPLLHNAIKLWVHQWVNPPMKLETPCSSLLRKVPPLKHESFQGHCRSNHNTQVSTINTASEGLAGKRYLHSEMPNLGRKA